MRILVLANFDLGLYNFRKELLQKLIDIGYEVYISLPYGEKVEQLKEMGCKYIETKLERHGINPLLELKLIRYYSNIMKKIGPDVVLSYTIKPNLYGGIVATKLKIPYISNITGLGTVIEKDGILKIVILKLYKLALKKSCCIFFQNAENEKFFDNNGIKFKRHRLIPGSGVNLEQYKVYEYPEKDKRDFVFISRVMRDKGIQEYLEAAEYIKKKYPYTSFHICGFCEEDYEDVLKQKNEEGIIIYHGNVSDVRKIIEKTHCTIHPSYHEGMSNVLLESSACGRPCLCSDIPGCREIVENNKSGILFESKNTDSLIESIEKFLSLSYEEQKQMGLYARQKVEKEFNRQIIVDAYIEEINKIKEKKSE